MPPLVEDYISNFVGFQAEIPPHSMHFVELASWEEFNIQIAVVGLDHCGTTSARMNLGLHPKVDFSTSQVPLLLEDTFFTWAIAWHLLPPKYLQKHWLEFNNARRQSSSSVLGLHNAVLWKHSIARLGHTPDECSTCADCVFTGSPRSIHSNAPSLQDSRNRDSG